jgi:hypothetical protein
LDSLGITDPAQAKAALDSLKAAEDAKKTDAEQLATLRMKTTSQEQALNVAIAQVTARITTEQKAAVDQIAGTDQALWLKTYGVLAPTWAAAIPAIAAATPIVAPAVPPAPVSTAPIAPAPGPTTPTSPPDHVAVYARMKKDNPFAATAYFKQHGDACFSKT